MSRTVTRDQQAAIYRAAFDQVCDPTDWKAPVDCVVPKELHALYANAIEFMTGVKPEVRAEGVSFDRLTCVGYRNGPCGG